MEASGGQRQADKNRRAGTATATATATGARCRVMGLTGFEGSRDGGFELGRGVHLKRHRGTLAPGSADRL